MHSRPWTRLFLVVACLLVPRVAPGQTGPSSHRPIQTTGAPLDEQGLSDRVRSFREQRELDALIEALKQRPELKQWNPAELEHLRQQVATDPRFKDPEYLKSVTDRVNRGSVPDEMKAAIQKAGAPDPPRIPPKPTGSTPPDKPKDEPRETAPPEPLPTEGGDDSDWLERQAVRRLDSMLRLVDRSNNRDAGRVRDALRRLADPNRVGRDFSGWKDPTNLNLSASLGRFGRFLAGERGRAGGRLPSAPNFAGPPGSWSGPAVDGSDGAGRAILWLLIAALLLAVAWQVLSRVRTARGLPAWRLGPWPVDPRRVACRGDLVQAFEYLACLLLGPQARNRHHLQLADLLGQDRPPAARQAAVELGRLYQQARYAPPDEPLPESDLLAARRDLVLLAGGSA